MNILPLKQRAFKNLYKKIFGYSDFFVKKDPFTGIALL